VREQWISLTNNNCIQIVWGENLKKENTMVWILIINPTIPKPLITFFQFKSCLLYLNPSIKQQTFA